MNEEVVFYFPQNNMYEAWKEYVIKERIHINASVFYSTLCNVNGKEES